MRFDVLTTFPELFGTGAECALGASIPGRARAAGVVEVHAHNIRAWTLDKHGKTDDRPFGGGPGMVMTCQPLYDAVLAVERMDPRPSTRLLLTPQGVALKQSLVEELAGRPRVLLIAGHYEGIDERVIEALSPREVSVGDYVLSGGELAAMVVIDAIVRLLPGSLGDGASTVNESFGVAGESGERLLDCPQYTKPREWMGRGVPDVLLSGDHGAIAKWRLEQRRERTRRRRPDLLGGVGESEGGA